MTDQICNNPPRCFGDIVFEEKDNPCTICAFYELCDKVGDAVAFHKKALLDLERKGWKKGNIISSDWIKEQDDE